MLKTMASSQMNLADPELELIDPTPNVHNLFVHFDSVFFWTALAGRALVRWSKKMYSCAGICSYEGRNGICDIALSEPLLKLRPRKDLVETLLHEMIHAFLFITNRDSDRDGHGPNFQAHMHRINKAAGLNISIYHDFHDEVELYMRHWWRCNGPCQKMKPYFGIVRRSVNRAPGPSDSWWTRHKRFCGGTFIKIKEPEQVVKTKKPKDGKTQKVLDGYIDKSKESKPINKPKEVKPKDKQIKKITPPLTVHNGNLSTNKRKSMETDPVVEKVRDVWRNKQFPTLSPLNKTLNKNKSKVSNVESPPKKMKKIDDYFKITANSLIKEIYGNQIEVILSDNNNKLTAMTKNDLDPTKMDTKEDLVECPNCNRKVSSKLINTHLDECLNREILEELTKDTPSTSQTERKSLKDLVGTIKEIPPYKNIEISSIKTEKPTTDNKRKTDFIIPKYDNEFKIKTEPSTSKSIKVEFDTEQKSPNIDKKEPEFDQKCPCCGDKVNKSVVEHLDECLAFFNNNTTVPIEGNSSIDTIVIDDDDDDQFDESQILNATGTKSPCPCCMKMVEIAEMNEHLDVCLNS